MYNVLSSQELYNLGADDLLGTAFPFIYHLLEVEQAKDVYLGKSLSNVAYSVQTFCGGRKTHTLICHNAQIPCTL